MALNLNVRIAGLSPIIMHSTRSMDDTDPLVIEKKSLTNKRGTNRTAVDEARIKQISCELALWLDPKGKPTIPPAALRTSIESGARKLRQGPQVREGLMVVSCDKFSYDEAKYGTTLEELSMSTQFTVPVVISRQRILSTRSKFDLDWSAEFSVEVYDDVVDVRRLEEWVAIAGKRIGLGDWRPEKSGLHGRFELVSITGV